MSAHLVGITMAPLGLSENGDGRSGVQSVGVDTYKCSSGYSRRFLGCSWVPRNGLFSLLSQLLSSPSLLWPCLV